MSVSLKIPGHDNLHVPSFSVMVGGQDVAAKYGIVSFMVSRHVNRINMARLVLHDGSASKQEFELSSKKLFKPGEKITIKAGYAQKEKTIFKGIVVKHSIKAPLHGNSVITLELRHEAIKMTVIRKNKYHKKTSDMLALKSLLSDNGITGKIDPTAADTEKELVQYYCTDWDFLVSRAEANGLLVFCNDDNVSVSKPIPVPTGLPLILTYGDNIVEFEGEYDARRQVKKATARSWSSKQQKIKKKNSLPGVDKVASPGNWTGDEISKALELNEVQLQHSGAVEDAELQAWAGNVLMRSRLSKVNGRVRIYGTNAVKPGDIVKLGGLGERFNGFAFVGGVVHGYDVKGTWTTDIYIGLDNEAFAEKYSNIMDRPSAGLLPGMNGLLVGVVTKIAQDPGNEFRIKVRVPVISEDEEGVWARVASFDAGNERGMLFRPEVNDEVILGFINDDPRDPVILGMMHSSKNKVPADLKATEQQNNIKGLVTKSKIKLLFDDQKKKVTVETPGKNSIVIDDEKKSITLKDQNGNKIIMDDKGITIDSAKDITLKAKKDIKMEGANINAKAKSQFKAEGSSGAELSSSAQAVIKGGVVKIN